MRLLVSVRDAPEAQDALLGGADIVDAKEPVHGPLAPVDPDVLEAIARAVPLSVALSVALGDAEATHLPELVMAVSALSPRRQLIFKAAITDASPAEALRGLRTAAQQVAHRADTPALVVARYVDSADDAADLGAWIDAISEAGARGLLLDTSDKSGPGLVALLGSCRLAQLRQRADEAGIWLAVAGGVSMASMADVMAARPHVIGVRGAVCSGGRAGVLEVNRVVELRDAIAGATLQQAS
jgi:uncharacterized protein (UPF0264 family)